MKTASLLSAGLLCALLSVGTFAATDPGRYSFTVLAGAVGTKGYVDGVGSAARFDNPGGMAADAAGNVYLSERDLSVIRKISPEGVVSTLAGAAGQKGAQDGLGAAARFNTPSSLAVDVAGSVYVADTGNHVVRKIDGSGKVTTIAGTAGERGTIDGPREVARLDSPLYLGVDGANNVYVSHGGSWREGFQKIAPDGTVSTVHVTLPYSIENYGDIWLCDLRADRTGNLYAVYSDAWDFIDLVKLTPDGAGHYNGVVIDPPTSWRTSPAGLALDDADTLYAKFDGKIFRFAPGRAAEIRALAGDPIESTWSHMAVDRSGTLFVTTGKLFQTSGPTIDLSGAIERGVFHGEAPAFHIRPQSQTIELGRTVAFNAAATGAPAATYQWTRDGVAITGATDTTLILTQASSGSAGTYRCIASNSSGSVTSEAATLSFANATAGGRISGFSVRANLLVGRSLVAGVVTSGGSKPVLLRAVGPGLQPFMAPGAAFMPDPRLELYDAATTLVAANDNWGGDPAVAAAFASAGTFPLASDARDAALLCSLNGAHTAHVLGGAGGIALFEVYDAGGNPGSRLVNLSVRSQVTRDEGALIAGIVITGTTARTVLVRGLGPMLRQFGVRDALDTPKLEIFDAVNVLLAENDDWSPGRAWGYPELGSFLLPTGSGKKLAEIARQVGAFELSIYNRDAAVLVTLPPGSHTVMLSGVGGATGEALIEIYEVP